MPRRAREESPTEFYHVMMRGVNRERIFRLKKHKELFLKLLKEEIENINVKIGAYCIMDNHVHIIIKSELANLSKILKKINIKFAMRYNKNFDRVGHVFQGRYRSEIILTDIHLIQAVRYVHKNPVKAGIVSNIKKYEWSSYKDYLFQENPIISEDIKSLILNVSGSKKEFEKFHSKENTVLFLDVDDEFEKAKEDIANNIIEDYCKNKGSIELCEIKDNREDLEGLINLLLRHTQFSHREIAQLLEVNRNLVHKINNKVKV